MICLIGGIKFTNNEYFTFKKRYPNNAIKLGYFIHFEAQYFSKVIYTNKVIITDLKTGAILSNSENVGDLKGNSVLTVTSANASYGLSSAYLINFKKSYLEFKLSMGYLLRDRFKGYHGFESNNYSNYDEVSFDYLNSKIKKLFLEVGVSYAFKLARKPSKEIEECQQ